MALSPLVAVNPAGPVTNDPNFIAYNAAIAAGATNYPLAAVVAPPALPPLPPVPTSPTATMSRVQIGNIMTREENKHFLLSLHFHTQGDKNTGKNGDLPSDHYATIRSYLFNCPGKWIKVAGSTSNVYFNWDKVPFGKVQAIRNAIQNSYPVVPVNQQVPKAVQAAVTAFQTAGSINAPPAFLEATKPHIDVVIGDARAYT